MEIAKTTTGSIGMGAAPVFTTALTNPTRDENAVTARTAPGAAASSAVNYDEANYRATTARADANSSLMGYFKGEQAQIAAAKPAASSGDPGLAQAVQDNARAANRVLWAQRERELSQFSATSNPAQIYQDVAKWRAKSFPVQALVPEPRQVEFGDKNLVAFTSLPQKPGPSRVAALTRELGQSVFVGTAATHNAQPFSAFGRQAQIAMLNAELAGATTAPVANTNSGNRFTLAASNTASATGSLFAPASTRDPAAAIEARPLAPIGRVMNFLGLKPSTMTVGPRNNPVLDALFLDDSTLVIPAKTVEDKQLRLVPVPLALPAPDQVTVDTSLARKPEPEPAFAPRPDPRTYGRTFSHASPH